MNRRHLLIALALLTISAAIVLLLPDRKAGTGPRPPLTAPSDRKPDDASPEIALPSREEGPAAAQREVEPPALHGRVADDSDHPVSGAVILVRTPEATPVARIEADTEGRYHLRELPPGPYRLIVLAPGILTRVIRDVAAPTVGAIDIVVPRGLDISGTVVADSGAPLAGVTVGVAPLSPEGRPLLPHLGGVETREDGAFLLRGLPLGRYGLFPSRDGLRFETPSPVPSGVDDVVIRAARGCRVTGVVVDPDGRPVAGARVTAEPEAPGAVPDVMPPFPRAYASSGEDGRFEFPWLPSCPLRLRAEHAEFLPSEVRGVVGDREGVELRLTAKLSRISGEVRGRDGTPVGDAIVEAVSEGDADFSRVARCDSEGRFLVRGLLPGEYRLRAGARGVATTLDHIPAGTTGVELVIDLR